MSSLKEFFRSKPSSADIARKIDEAQVERSRHEAEETRLLAEREAVYLDGTQAEIDALEANLRNAEGAISRLGIQIEGLRKREQEVVAREQSAALDAEVKAACKASDEGVVLIGEYEKLAARIVNIMRSLQDVERIVCRTNAKLHEAGRTERVMSSEEASLRGPCNSWGVLPKKVRLPGVPENDFFWWDGPGSR